MKTATTPEQPRSALRACLRWARLVGLLIEREMLEADLEKCRNYGDAVGVRRKTLQCDACQRAIQSL